MNAIALALALHALPLAPPLPTPTVPPSGLSMQPPDQSRVGDVSRVRGTYDTARVARVAFALQCWRANGSLVGDWTETGWNTGEVNDWQPTLMQGGWWVPLRAMPTRAQLPLGGRCTVDVIAENRDGGLVTRFRHTLFINQKM